MTPPLPTREERQSGFTLVELMVAVSIAMVLVVVALGVVVNSSKVVMTSKQLQDLNEEARQALNRMARDIRQSRSIVMAVNPDRPTFNSSGLVAVGFQSDFDGDGCIGGNPVPGGPTSCNPYSAGNPEDLTYCFQPGVAQLFIIDNQASSVPVTSTSTSCSGGQPLLAGNVSGFQVAYRSNLYRYDLDPSDGVTTWRELDATPPPVGNGNGELDVELSDVDSVVITVTMSQGGRSQVYRSQIDLRNSSK
jgi:type II secretory pathway pseudopilin PulG